MSKWCKLYYACSVRSERADTGFAVLAQFLKVTELSVTRLNTKIPFSFGVHVTESSRKVTPFHLLLLKSCALFLFTFLEIVSQVLYYLVEIGVGVDRIGFERRFLHEKLSAKHH